MLAGEAEPYSADEGARRVEEPHLLRAMGWLRILSGSIEIAAALFIWRSFRVEQAVRINAALGLAGPVFFFIVSALGLAGLAGRLSLIRICFVLAGIGLVFAGTRS